MTDPTSRALQLLGLLQRRAVWSGAELADHLGVTTRTVRRDVDRLRELGYVVEADTGLGGGYALGRGQVLPPLLLDEDEALAVTLALGAAARSSTGTGAEVAVRALGKIDDVLPAALRSRLQGLRATMDLSPTGAGVDTDVLATCAEAARRSLRLRFTYRDRRGRESARDVEPHRLTALGRAWYLTAFDVEREDWRSFRLDRISDPEPSTFHTRPRPGLEEALARLREAPPPSAYAHRVVVHVAAPLAELEGRLGGGGELRALDDGATEWVTGADDPVQAAWWLARMPHDFTVLGDDAVRQAVARLGRRLSDAAPGTLPD